MDSWMASCVCAFRANTTAPTVSRAAEEHIRGVLEKTVKAGACAQATDALNDTYYVVKTAESEKMCNELMGKRVVLTGVVEQRAGDPAYYLNLKAAEPYQPKLPPKPAEAASPSAPLPPAPATGTEAPKTGETLKSGETPKAAEAPKAETPKAPEATKAETPAGEKK
jgi:hypothetical protein